MIQSIFHFGFNFYWTLEIDNQRDIQVLIAVRKYILNKVMIENRTQQVSYLYCIILDIKELNSISGKYSKKTKVVNFYDNKVGNKYIW